MNNFFKRIKNIELKFIYFIIAIALFSIDIIIISNFDIFITILSAFILICDFFIYCGTIIKGVD